MSTSGPNLDPKSVQYSWFDRLIIATCMAFGAWWLQNQWNSLQETLRILSEHQRYSAETYISRKEHDADIRKIEESFQRLDTRFDRIDDKLDELQIQER